MTAQIFIIVSANHSAKGKQVSCKNSIKLFVNKAGNYFFLKFMSSKGMSAKENTMQYHHCLLVPVLLRVS